MASTDAKAIPVKNVAMRLTFPIFDADGDLVTGATGLDSEVSKDGGTFTDCTNEATEIATSSGMYYLDLTSTEMNADTVAIIVKTSSSGAKTTPIVLYTAARSINDLAWPTTTGRSMTVAATGEVTGDVGKWNGTAVSTPDTAGQPKVTVAAGTGTGQLSLTSGVIDSNITKWSGTAVAAPDTAGYPKVTHKVGTGTGEINLSSGGVPVSSIAASAITATSIATDAITAAKIAADAIGASELAADAVTEIVNGVWNEALAGHSTAGTAGKALSDTGSGASAGAIADAVWDEARSGHVAAGSFGEGTLIYGFTAGESAVLADEIADAILDADPADHQLADTIGLVLSNLSDVLPATPIAAATGVPSAGAIADAVWDEAMSGHKTAGTAGAVVQPRVHGVTQSGSTGTTIRIASGDTAATGDYVGRYILVDHGTTGEHAVITANDGTTKVLTVDRTFDTIALTGEPYEIAP